jgi:hypothetical protein
VLKTAPTADNDPPRIGAPISKVRIEAANEADKTTNKETE